MRLEGNPLECLPTTTLPEVDDDDVSVLADGLRVDPYGDECGCSIPDVTDNVCGEEMCTPGEVGFICATGTLAPVPAPTQAPVVATLAPVAAPTEAPASATPSPVAEPTDAPVPATPAPVAAPTEPPASAILLPAPEPTTSPNPSSAATSPAPSAAPSFDITSTATPVASPTEQKSSSDSTAIVAGVISAVAGAALIALTVLLKRRRATTQKITDTRPPAAIPAQGNDDNNPDRGLEQPLDVSRPASAPLVVGRGDDRSPSHEGKSSPHRSTPAEDDGENRGDGVPPSAPAPPDVGVQTSAEYLSNAVENLFSKTVENRSPSQQRNASPQGHTPARVDAGDGGGIVPPSAMAPFDGGDAAADDRGIRLACEEDAAGGSAEKSLTTTASIATTSTANMSTAEQEEIAQCRQRQHAADAAALVADGPTPEGEASGGDGDTGASSTVVSRQSSAGDIGLGQAVLVAAQELAQSCHIPGVSEAAGAVCIMANLCSDSRENDKASTSRLRQCRSFVLALKRADKVVGKGGDTIGEAALALIEDVHDAIVDLVELIKTFKSKNKLSKLFLSTLFKRRQEELDAVVDRAIMRLQLGLQVQAGHDMSSMKDSMRSMEDDVSAVKDGVKAVEEGMHLQSQGSTTETTSESVAEARRIRRQRKLDRVEIPKEHLFISNDVLGKGGFGEVYLADYNGHNAAAKVLNIAHDLGALDENQQQRETSQRTAFLRELEAMIRLRSPNTVNVFGAVTSLPDRMVLVMELMPNGDVRTLLKNSEQPLPEEHCRRIIGDVCAGMAFLHSKETVHGDLKSANVLLDGAGRAKIGDFGTSRWSHHTDSTGLATYTKAGQNTQMSLAWSAPEVLDASGSTYASDVYSFGIVVWEVLSRELPWANVARPREVYIHVVLKSLRPDIPVDAPADIVNMMTACWTGGPEARPTFSTIMERIESSGWSE